MKSDIVNLLGKNIRDPEIIEFEKGLKESPLRKVDNDLMVVHFCFRESGVELVADSGFKVNTVFLFSPTHKRNMPGYKGVLPEDLTFTVSRGEVRSRLGNPGACGEECSDYFLGKLGAWDRYWRETYYLHIQYHIGQNSVDQISVMQEQSL